MANASHPHLFTHEWFERHPRLAANFGKETAAMVVGTLLAIVTVFATTFDWAENIPMGASEVADFASRSAPDASTPPAISNDFADQFIEQKKAATTEVLPEQF